MFSGIVEEVGKITAVQDSSDGKRLKISARVVLEGCKIGDSIAVSGICLTVTLFGADWFTVDASFETLRKTRLGQMKPGYRVNLERALKVSDRLGGHLVSGHIDGLATVAAVREEGFSRVIEFSAAPAFAPYFIEKGSVGLDGISLTIASLTDNGSDVRFTVAAIPHTLEVTTLGELKPGDTVNLETDLIGKYVARWLGVRGAPNINKEGLSLTTLAEYGYT
ncbi:MAG: riboflavin synthase [Candidatus Obscuribacterales bacterium]|nr:riboflavin synthase [Candidatus Obscuribacterales bacterium]